MPVSARVCSLQDLRNYIEITICQFNQLEPRVFQMTERVLSRQGQPCGMYFCLHGPRSVKLAAIWETDKNTILFYGSRGERVGRYRVRGMLTLGHAA